MPHLAARPPSALPVGRAEAAIFYDRGTGELFAKTTKLLFVYAPVSSRD